MARRQQSKFPRLARHLFRTARFLLGTEAGDSGWRTVGGDPRITVASFLGIAGELYQLVHARKPAIASEELVRGLLLKSAETEGTKGLTERFLMSEWTHGVDAWQTKTAQGYADLPRFGRKSRVGLKNRERLWPIFERVIKELERRGFLTDAGVYQALTERYSVRTEKPFTHVVVDEAQDLGVAEFASCARLCRKHLMHSSLQAILVSVFSSNHFSWAALGIDVRGRS